MAGIIIGLWTGWMLWQAPKKQIAEAPAPAIRQEDKSLILERKPDPSAKPAQKIPKGAVVERVISVELQSHGPSSEAPAGIIGSTPMDLPASPSLQRSNIRVDLTLVRLQDGSRRVIASSPDAEVVGGLDIPTVPIASPHRELKWAAGEVYGTTAWGDKAVGGFLDRDLAFARVGAEVTKNTYALASRTGWEVRAKFGIRF